MHKVHEVAKVNWLKRDSEMREGPTNVSQTAVEFDCAIGPNFSGEPIGWISRYAKFVQ